MLVKWLIMVLLIGELRLLSIAIASCLGWCVARAIVVIRYKGNKNNSKLMEGKNENRSYKEK